MNNLFDLSGKTAIVTGASTGLGKGMTLGLANAGADILLVDHVSSEETFNKVKNILICGQNVGQLTPIYML